MHKKYTYKGGKKFGPYYYETKRIDGKVVTTYLGQTKPDSKKINFFSLAVFFILVSLIFSIYFLSYSLTGNASLDIKEKYNFGEEINGKLNLKLLEGELLPAGTKIIVSYGNITRVLNLSDLVSDDLISGEFYASGVNLIGQGDGYGVVGKIKEYPSIKFKLKISKEEEFSKENNESSEIENNLEEDSNPISEEESQENELQEDEKEKKNEKEKVDEKEEEKNEGSKKENVDEKKEEEKSEENEISNEESSESDSQSSGGESTITGQSVSDSSFIDGEVSKENQFVYSLSKDEFAHLVNGSVYHGNLNLEDDHIKVKSKNNKVVVSTNYFVEVEGFGEKYLGKVGKKLSINFDAFELIADSESTLKVYLEYDGERIVESSKEIKILKNDSVQEESNLTEDFEEDLINESNQESEVVEFNDTEVLGNLTEGNQTELSNITEGNTTLVINESLVDVDISQFSAVLGQPVRWVKKISLNNITENLSLVVEVPVSAVNITIDKISTQDSGEVSALFEPDISFKVPDLIIGITGEVTADVIAEIDLGEETIFSKIIKFFRITGKSIDEIDKENIKEIYIELKDTDLSLEVEYYTESPQSTEELLDDGTKRVFVSSPQDVHYEDVLIFTNLSDSLEITSYSDVMVKWLENDTYLEISFINDSNNDGYYDYIEWVAPHLSNQTFDIILITDAKHLDENKNFLSNIYNETKELDGVWSETIPDGHYVRVTFERNLTSQKDITIYPRIVSGNPVVNVYSYNDSVLLEQFNNLVENSYNKIYLNNLTGTQDTFDLHVLNGSLEFDHIIDPVPFSSVTSGIAVYMQNSQVLPRYSLWNKTDFGVEQNAPTITAGGTPWIRVRSSTQRNQTVVGLLDSNGDILFNIYNITDNNWDSWLDVADIGTTLDADRAFDVEVEDLSGDFVVVYEKDTSNDNLVYYRTWDGTQWSNEGTITLNGDVVAEPQTFFVLERRVGSNEMMMATMGRTSDDLTAARWDGSSFTEVTTITTDGAPIDEERFSIAYEGISGDAMLAWSNTSNVVEYKIFSDSIGGWGPTSVMRNRAAVVHQVTLCSDPVSDYIGAIIGPDSANDVLAVVWNGSSWLSGEPGEEGGAENVATANAYCTWTKNSSVALFTYVVSNALNITYFTYNKDSNTWTCPENGQSVTDLDNAEGSNGPCLAGDGVTSTHMSDDIEVLRSVADPNSNDIMIWGLDLAEDFEMYIFNGTYITQPTNALLEQTTTTVTPTAPGAFDYFRFPSSSSGQGQNSSSLEVTINFPTENATYLAVYDLPFNFNVSLNKNGSVKYTLDGGLNNFSMVGNEGIFGTSFNHTNESIALGDYTFRVYANDTLGNNNYSESVNFSLIQENIILNSTLTNSTGSSLNATILIYDESSLQYVYNYTGENHTQILSLNTTYRIDLIPLEIESIDQIRFRKVNFSESDGVETEAFSVDEQTDIGNFTKVFSIDPVIEHFDNATVTFTATANSLFKCQDWNFTQQSCFGNWTLYMRDLVVGQTYNFTLYPGDPGYGIINITDALHLDSNRSFISNIYNETYLLDNVWSETIPDGDYVRVTFELNLTPANDITIYPRIVSGNPIVNVYELNNVTEILATFGSLVNDSYNTIYLTNLTGTQDTFDLQVVGGSLEFDHIIDPTIYTNVPMVAEGIAPLAENKFIIVYTNGTDNSVRFMIKNTNGTHLVGPVTVANGTGPGYNRTTQSVSRVAVTTINSTSFIIAWTNLTGDWRAGYNSNGGLYFNPAFSDGSIGASFHDIALTVYNSTAFAYCYVDRTEGDLDMRRFNSINGGLIGTETDVNAALAPETNLNNLIDCVAVNDTAVAAFGYDAGTDDDATYHLVYHNGTEGLTDQDIDSAVGNSGQVALAAIDRNKYAMGWYNSSTIRIAIRQVHNTAILAPTLVSNAGTISRVAMATVLNTSTNLDNFVIVWYNQSSQDILAKGYNGSGTIVMPEIKVEDNPYTLPGIMSATGKHSVSGMSLCNGTWAVAYTNSTNFTLIKTYWLNGTEWDGECNVASDPNLISSCGTLSSPGVYTQSANIIPSDSGNPCITIGSSNITFNGAGYWIANSTFTNNGIYASGKLNVTISYANVTVNHTTSAINFVSVNNSFIMHTTSNRNQNGISLDSGSSNNRLNNLSSNFNTQYGIYVISNSNNNLISNLTLGANTLAGIIIDSGVSNNIVENATITASTYGVFLSSGSNNTIQKSNINGNTHGIVFFGSNNNFVHDTNSSNNVNNGVYLLFGAHSNYLRNVTSNANLHNGFYFDATTNNTLRNVTANLNSNYGLYLLSASNSNDINNLTANANLNGVYVAVNSNHNLLKNLITINNTNNGVYLTSSSNNTFDNIFTYNNSQRGVFLDSSNHNNRISNLTANNNVQYGLVIAGTSLNNTVQTGNANNNQYGVLISVSHNNSITDFVSNNNSNHGFYFYSGSNNTLSNVTFRDNSLRGIFLEEFSDTNVVRNVSGSANQKGIFVTSSYGNYFSGGFVNASTQDAISIQSTSSINNSFENISLTNTNSNYYDINFLTESINQTNLINMPHIGNYTFGNTGGRLVVKNNLYGEVKFIQPVTGTGSNLSADIVITNNSATVRSNVNQGLNKSANVTLHGVSTTFTTPIILRDGVLCTTCYNFTSLNAGTVVFNVSYWTNYSVGEGAVDNPPIVNLIAPTNATKTGSVNNIISFNATFTDDGVLKNSTFYLWNSTPTLINTTNFTLSGASGSSNLTFNFPYNGTFYWNYFACDTNHNCAMNRTNFTIFYSSMPQVTINLPSTGVSLSPVSFNVTISNINATYVNYTLTNGLVNYTMQNNGNRDFNATNSSIAPGSYTVRYFAWDSAGNLNSTQTRVFTIGQSLRLMAQTCIAMEDSVDPDSYGSACDSTYPSPCPTDLVSCEDLSYEEQSANEGTYGGIRITLFNNSISNCKAISNVKLCYNWESTESEFFTCDIYFDSNGGSSYTSLGGICPATGGSASTNCVDVTSSENWNCGNFFGASGTRSLIRTEVLNELGGSNSVRHDLIWFNVTYTDGIETLNFTSPLNGSTTTLRSVNVTLFVNDTNVSSGGNKNWTRIYADRSLPMTNEHLIYSTTNFPLVNGNVYLNYSIPPLKYNATQGMFLLYHFDNNTHYGENLTRVTDFATYRFNATYLNVNGDRELSKDGLGLAYEIDNTENIAISDNPLLNSPTTTGQITFMTWINLSSSSAIHTVNFVLDKGLSAENKDYQLFFLNSTKKLTFSFSNGTTEIQVPANSAINYGSWYHYAFTFNRSSGNATVYLNGVADTSTIVPAVNNLLINTTASLYIGGISGALTAIGLLDDLALFNKTLSASEILDIYRLKAGDYYLRANVSDNWGGFTDSQINTFSVISDPNRAPYNGTAIVINSTLGLNRTKEDIHVRTTLLDLDNNLMNVTVKWYNNTIQHLVVDYNSSYSNGSTFIASLGFGNTTKGQNWSAEIIITDGIDSSSASSGNITILNSPPNISLISPINNTNTINRTTQFFTFTSADDDNDFITESMNLSLRASTPCSDSNYNGATLYTPSSPNEFTLNIDGAGPLKCLIDNGDYYFWSVRVSDGTVNVHSSPLILNVQAYLNLIMNISNVQFGNLGYLGTNDTTDNSPQPIIMINEGNVMKDIKVHATDLWQSVTNPSRFFQYKFDNVSTNGIYENKTFLSGVVSYANVSSSVPGSSNLVNLNYTDSADSVEVDFNVTVPNTEGPGFKNSTITFTISLGTGEQYIA